MAIITTISILSFSLTLLYAFLVLFLKRGWLKIPKFEKNNTPVKTKVSILIAARNEEEKIHFTIEDLLQQNYPKQLVEIIIIDDHSTDDTANVITKYAVQGVKLLKLNENKALNSYKKKAIADAIQISTGELIITTDADCRMGTNWLPTIVSFYEQYNYNLISSPVVFFEENSKFERLQTLEFLYLIGLGAAGIGNKMPSTCNGANLAYKKDVFLTLGGFKGIDDLASGDDELFLHKVAHAYPETIGFCKSTDTIVYTHAKPTLKEFISQRKRWASKSVKYKDKKIIVLGILIWLFNCSLIINLLLGLFYNYQFFFILMLQYLIKIIAEYSFLKLLTSFAKREKLINYLYFLTFAHTVYLVFIGIAGNGGKYDWKGRKVN